MIQDVDESVRNLLKRDAINGSDVEIVLDAPTKDWSARRSGPTVDLYLYDIRESLGFRQEGWVEVRNDAGHITARRPPVRCFRLSYLITAWTQRPEDEHRLLSAIMSCVMQYDVLPSDVLVGSLVELEYPIEMTMARPPPEDRAISEIWSALGGELKPSLDLVLVAPMVAGQVRPAAELVRESPKFVFADEDRSEEASGSRAAAVSGGRGSGDDGSESEDQAQTAVEETVGGAEPDIGRVLRVREIPRRR